MKKISALLLAITVLLCSCAVSNAPAPQPEESSSSQIIEDASQSTPEPPESSKPTELPENSEHPESSEAEAPAPPPPPVPKKIDIPADKADIITWIMDENNGYPLDGGYNTRYIDAHIPQLNINTKTAEIINNEIKTNFYTPVQEAIANTADMFPNDYQIYSQVALYKEYLSIRINQRIIPNYGTDGEVYTVVYDTESNTIVTFDDMLKKAELTNEDVYTAIQKDAFDNKTPTYFKCKEFFMNSDGSIDLISRYGFEDKYGDIDWHKIYTYTYYPEVEIE